MSQKSKKKQTDQKPGNPVPPAPIKNSFPNLLSENNLPGTIIGITLLLIFIIFHKFLFGNAYYLFKDIGSDTLNTFYPHFVHVNKYMKTEGFPLWSFAQGMGQNIQSISVNDPFYFVIYLFFPNNIAYGIIWMEMIKILLTAIISLYIFSSWNLQPVNRMIGALLIAFSSFMIIGSGWYIFSTEVVFFTLLLLGFERIYRQKSWYLFPLAIALIAANQPFNLYLYGLFLILYIVLRLIAESQFNLRNILSLTGKLFALSLLGLLISSFFFWSSLQQILDSPRVSGTSGYFNILQNTPLFSTANALHNTTAILRAFSSDILGPGSGYNGWGNFLEAPLFFMGILPLVMMPQILAAGNINRAIPFLALFILFIIPVIFPFWRYAFWLFTGDYYRGLSFFLGLSLLFMTLISLENIAKDQKINLLVLGITAGILLGLLYFPFNNIERLINKDAQALARNFIFIYTLIIGLAAWKSFRPYFQPALLLLIILELGVVNYKSLDKRSVLSRAELKQKTGYDDYSIEAVNFIQTIDNGFFRLHKSFASSPAIHESYNDAKVQNFYSTRVYGSFNQSYYIRFLEEIGIIKKGNEMQSRWVIGFTERPILQTWASSKYLLYKGNARHLHAFGYDSLTQTGDIKIFRNRYFLPLGFGYDTYITAEDFKRLSPLNKDLLLLRAFVADDKDIQNLQGFKRFDIRDTLSNYDFPDYFRFAESRKADTLSLTLFSQNRIKGAISVDSTKMLFLSIPYDKGWHATLDGKEVKPLICNIGFIGIPLTPGSHDLELKFRPQFFMISLWGTIAGVLIYSTLIFFHYLRRKKAASGSSPGPNADNTNNLTNK